MLTTPSTPLVTPPVNVDQLTPPPLALTIAAQHPLTLFLQLREMLHIWSSRIHVFMSSTLSGCGGGLRPGGVLVCQVPGPAASREGLLWSSRIHVFMSSTLSGCGGGCGPGGVLANIPKDVCPPSDASASSTLSAACFCVSSIAMPARMGRKPSSPSTNRRRNVAAAAACSDGRWQSAVSRLAAGRHWYWR